MNAPLFDNAKKIKRSRHRDGESRARKRAWFSIGGKQRKESGAKMRVSSFGGYDLIKHGASRYDLRDPYHIAIDLSWKGFALAFVAAEVAINLVFASLYFINPGCIDNANSFFDAFFFSVETLATVGYGDMHPQTPYGHIVAMIEIFVGLMMLALITGMMFARFSRPRARFMFAKFGVVRPLDGKLTLMFRAANARLNVVQEASAVLRMMRDEVTAEGFRLRRITDLPLVRSQHPVFSLGWNLMHVIDETSPLAAETPASLAASSTVFFLSLSGTDETTGQMLMARCEYRSDCIRWNEAFKDILDMRPDGTLHIDFGKFDQVEPLPATAAADTDQRSRMN